MLPVRSNTPSRGSRQNSADRFFSCDCGALLRRLTSTRVVEDSEALLFALTWAQPQRYGTPPSPRNGHTMTLIGVNLFVFGGTDESISYNDVHTLHVETLTWDKPLVYGTLPSPRARHTATAVGTNLVVFGGVGGGNELHILETDNATWYIPKVGGEPPPPRFGHTATLVDSALDQSRKLYIFGGHDGRKSLSDLYLFDTDSMSWSRVSYSHHLPADASGPTLVHRLPALQCPVELTRPLLLLDSGKLWRPSSPCGLTPHNNTR